MEEWGIIVAVAVAVAVVVAVLRIVLDCRGFWDRGAYY